jgi:GNAT superfamily N-acetyltransferase
MPTQPSSPYLIRPAGPQDCAHLARLNTLFNGTDEPPAAYAARLADPNRVDTPLLAFLDEQAIGFACLRIVPQVLYPQPYAELTELYVEEPHRRQGAATRLLNFAEQLARQAGATELFILTGFDNHPAQQLYRRLGYAHGDLAMIKSLD